MTNLLDTAHDEVLHMETTFCAPGSKLESIIVGNSKYQKSVTIALWKIEKDGRCSFSQISPSLEEVDIIIQALQEAKERILSNHD